MRWRSIVIFLVIPLVLWSACATEEGNDPAPDDNDNTSENVAPNNKGDENGDSNNDDKPEEEDVVCGDGVRDDGQECDGGDLGGKSCADMGPPFGELGCLDTCEFDTAHCGGWTSGHAVEGRTRSYDSATDPDDGLVVTGRFEETLDIGPHQIESLGRDDLFIARFADGGSADWVRRYGGEDWVGGRAVDVTPEGDLLIAGNASGSPDMGGGPLNPESGSSSFFLARYDGNGQHVWSQIFGGSQSGANMVGDVTADSDGNAILVGRFPGNYDLGGGDLINEGEGNYDFYMLKVDSVGDHLWSQNFGGDGTIGQITGSAIDKDDNILVTGTFSGPISFGGESLDGGDNTSTFVAKYDPGGSHLWSQKFSSPDRVHGAGIATDDEGNALLTGRFREVMEIGDEELAGNDRNNGYVVKLDPDGAYLWSRTFGDNDSVAARGETIVTDVDGHVIVGGEFGSTMVIEDQQLEATDFRPDGMVATYDPDGEFISVTGLQGDGPISVQSASTTSDGHIRVLGAFEDTIAFGPDHNYETDDEGFFVIDMPPIAAP